jgi:hypothetical protein
MGAGITVDASGADKHGLEEERVASIADGYGVRRYA